MVVYRPLTTLSPPHENIVAALLRGFDKTEQFDRQHVARGLRL